MSNLFIRNNSKLFSLYSSYKWFSLFIIPLCLVFLIFAFLPITQSEERLIAPALCSKENESKKATFCQVFPFFQKILFLGLSDRPDSHYGMALIQVGKEKLFVQNKERLFFLPVDADRFAFSKEPTPLSLTINALQHDKMQMEIDFQGDHFSISEKIHLDLFKKEAGKNELCQMILLPSDLLQGQTNTRLLVTTLDGQMKMLLLPNEGELFFSYLQGRWQEGILEGAAIIKIFLEKRGADLVFWASDSLFGQQKRLTLTKSKPTLPLDKQIYPLRRKTLHSMECRIGSDVKLLKKGDFIFFEKGKNPLILRAGKEQEHFLNEYVLGELVVFEGVRRVGKEWVMTLTHYDSYRTSCEKVDLVCPLKHKK